MHRSFLEMPEIAGKVVNTLRVYNDPPSGREVYLEFSDGTRLSIDLGVETRLCSKHFTDENGDLKVLSEHRE